MREALRTWRRTDLIGRQPGALVPPGPAFGAWDERAKAAPDNRVRFDTHMGLKVERASQREESEENWESIVSA